MKIDLSRDDVLRLAGEYEYADDGQLATKLLEAVARGHLMMEELLAVARWKWSGGNLQKLCKQNHTDHLKETTEISFRTDNERLRIGSLLTLQGVAWPMASVILHFGFPDRYPILDVRAIRTVGGTTAYNFNNWWSYTNLCRDTADELSVSLRQLDKALWQADKERQSNDGQYSKTGCIELLLDNIS